MVTRLRCFAPNSGFALQSVIRIGVITVNFIVDVDTPMYGDLGPVVMKSDSNQMPNWAISKIQLIRLKSDNTPAVYLIVTFDT